MRSRCTSGLMKDSPSLPPTLRHTHVTKKLHFFVLRSGVWGTFSIFLGRTRTLDSHASRLRRKLNRNGDAGYVLNVWGVGYRLTAVA